MTRAAVSFLGPLDASTVTFRVTPGTELGHVHKPRPSCQVTGSAVILSKHVPRKASVRSPTSVPFQEQLCQCWRAGPVVKWPYSYKGPQFSCEHPFRMASNHLELPLWRFQCPLWLLRASAHNCTNPHTSTHTYYA